MVMRRGKKISFTCYKGICHGDLNLQNILLDEKENILYN
jgi:tRNA A-37 threonylcarbamoyl transferase component Bud32